MKIARRQLKVEVPTMAMGDIAFNLLVFFFILANPQPPLKWKPALVDQIDKVQRSPVVIGVDEDSKIYLNGRPISTSALARAVEEELGNLPVGQRKVHLKIHKDTTASLFEPVIEAVSQAGGELVHLVEQEGPGN